MSKRPNSRSFQSDFVGRIRNIALSPSPHNALAPVFEAVTNAIQAIEERFGEENLPKGKIQISVMREPETADSPPVGFLISDNGIGLNPTNFGAFTTSDTRLKIKKGGKGVGRFLWIKVFEKAHVASTYLENDKLAAIAFDFVSAETKQITNITSKVEERDVGTRVTLYPFREEYAVHCPRKASTIKNKIIGHFISLFINPNRPEITLRDIDGDSALTHDFSAVVEREQVYDFSVAFGSDAFEFKLHAFLLPKEYSDDEKGVNAVFYGANGRTVKRRDLDGALGLKSIDGRFAYFAFVEGEYLDRAVNQERTDFSWPEDFADDIHRAAIDVSKAFLSTQIGKIREKQAQIVRQVRDEHLRFFNVVRDPEEYAKSLQLSVQNTEDVFLELSRTSLRRYNKTKREFNDAKTKKLPDLDVRAKEFVTELAGESLSSLAEYVYKRKLILDVFEDRSEFNSVDEERYHLEETVHELICPLRTTSDELGYEDHNLWLIDDGLAFYTYFASDETVTKLSGGADRSRIEPDVAIFDLGLGFEQPQGTNPITIVEFKRPGRDDYTLAQNPFVQVRNYVSHLKKAGVAKDHSGKVIRQIEETTPFLCYVVADIEPTLKEMMDQFGPFHKKAGHGSYYKWDEPFKIFIEVASYAEIIRAARARHEAFFQKLGINS